MIKELSHEENVTKILASNSILKPQYQVFTDRTETLGDFLAKRKKETEAIENKNTSKYSFIDKNLKWF